MKAKGLNDNKITVQLGLSVGTLGKSRKEGRDLSDKVIEQILNFYTDLDRVWLLTGEGEMLRTTHNGVTAIVNGDHSAAAVNGNATVTDKVLEERVRSLEEQVRQRDLLLAEKERLIQVLLKSKM